MCYFQSGTREKSLLRWLTVTLGLQIQSIEPASSDASFRRYFRVFHSEGCHIVMDAPPDKENTVAFVHVANLFRSVGLHVPAIFEQNLDEGFLLLEDLGSRCYLYELQTDNADILYKNALDALFTLQCDVSIHTSLLPVYDRALLLRELDIFYDWFLEKRLGLLVPVVVRNVLTDCLLETALSQPQVCVHRDYHSRNLMRLSERGVGIIDFQDAVIGPITYDLVSLLRDCYISWPELQVNQWVADYYQKLLHAGMLNCKFEHFKRWFDWMGLQRHLKAVGIFSRLQIRDDKPGYLADIPRTMGYISAVCSMYPELRLFNDFLRQQVLPIYQSQL